MSSNGVLLLIINNPVVQAGFLGWAAAQTMKVALGIAREKRFNFKWFVGSGGMPSSHAALVMSVATSLGFYEGFASGIFGLALVFAFITMFDAQGVRQQSGRQAGALNMILDDIYRQKGIREEPLKELFGHTPVQVLTGAFVGVMVAIILAKQG